MSITSDDQFERDGRHPRPPIGGSLLYLLLNLPLGIARFTAVTTLLAFGRGTAIVWIGVTMVAALAVAARGAARAERSRAHTLLRTYIAMPFRPLPESGQKGRWQRRLTDAAIWRHF